MEEDGSGSEVVEVDVVVVVLVEYGLVPKGVPDRDADRELAVDMCDCELVVLVSGIVVGQC